jgi:hypothetical protein
MASILEERVNPVGWVKQVGRVRTVKFVMGDTVVDETAATDYAPCQAVRLAAYTLRAVLLNRFTGIL